MKRVIISVSAILALGLGSVQSQGLMGDNKNNVKPPRRFYVKANAQYGSMLNKPNMDILTKQEGDFIEDFVIQNYNIGFDIRAGRQTDDFKQNKFDVLFRFPQFGVGYYVGNLNHIILGNEEQTGFGKPAAVYAFFASPIVRTEGFRVNYDISLGLSYNFSPYDPFYRPYNILIGAKRNCYVNLRLTSEFDFGKNSTVGVGVDYLHFSNGSARKPNNGIDLLSVNLSYRYNLFQHSEKSYNRFPVEPYKPNWEWQVWWTNGARTLDTDFDYTATTKGGLWHCWSVSSAVLKQTSHRRKVGAGIDYFYFDWGRYVLEYRANEQGQQITTQPRDNMALGAFLTHEVGYKKAWLFCHLGFYLNNRTGDYRTGENAKNPRIYERVGVKYYVTPHLSVGVAIKAHFTNADYTEWTIGYSLPF